MKKMSFNQLRKEFLDFFESKGHLRLKSYSLIPNEDKSLLLINAGMAPLKDYFTGVKKMSKDRATSSQKCVRTGDIDNVGKTHRHATFFEMLGNFSFGDYFKKEAITWAWEFLTKVIELDIDKLSVSVYYEDEEAYNIWKDFIGLSEDKIQKLGKEDNFWEIEQGPCGPCTEIFYDRGESYSGDDRLLEIWNLVFTQYNKDENGEYHPLANPNIDTGMGLERLALVVEDVHNIFELSAFTPILKEIEKLSGKKYGEDSKADVSFRVIMDHSKALTFLIYDGVVPSNEGRGYVLRRLIRRAYRHGKLLDIKGHFLEKLSQIVMDLYSPEYPEILEDKDRVFKIINREEANFQQTIDQGLDMLNNIISKLKKEGKDMLSGKDAFRLYDTYGFPLDLTQEIAKDNSIKINKEDFDIAMKEQKEKSRANKKFKGGWTSENLVIEGFDATNFVGYESIESEANIIGIIGAEEDTIKEGDESIVILDTTPFFAECGGQTGDTGVIETENGRLLVTDTKKTFEEVNYHFVKCEKGIFKIGDKVEAKVDGERRRGIVKNHSATHLLHKVLRDVLGEHVFQSGSYVGPDRLRFDFNHYEALTEEQILEVERQVNKAILDNYTVDVLYTSVEESVKMGALGIFEDKYKEVVRIVDMGGYSIELCGGTHVSSTSEVMMFKILSETSVASGIRRIEAISGISVYEYLNSYIERENNISILLKTQKDKIEDKINHMLIKEKELESKITEYKSLEENNIIKKLNSEIVTKNDVNILISRLEDVDMESLKNIASRFQDKDSNKEKVLVLASVYEGRIYFVSTVSKLLIKKGLKAGDIVRNIAKATGGNGGGRPDFAQAGGKEIDKIDDALVKVKSFIEEKL